MTSITIYPGKTAGVVAAPPATTETRYALMLAAITLRTVHIVGADVSILLAGLESLGTAFRRQGGNVMFYAPHKKADACVCCTEDTLPLLLPLCMALGGRYTFMCGADTLHQHESAVRTLLEQAGFAYAETEDGFDIEGILSTQHIETDDTDLAAGLMLALPLMPGASVACTQGKAKLAHAARVMRRFGYITAAQGDGYIITQTKKLREDFVYTACGDYGIAAYLLLAGLTSGNAGLTGLIADCAQPEKCMIAHMAALGLPVREMDGAVFAKKVRLGDRTIDAREYASILPIIAALASLSRGKCVIKNVSFPYNKRGGTLEVTAQALSSMGADIMTLGGDMAITGKRTLYGAVADAGGNAQAAMAICAAALGAEVPTTVRHVPALGGYLAALRGLGVLVQ